jgi:hypothetical protein
VSADRPTDTLGSSSDCPRDDRVHGAAGLIPQTLWLMQYLTAGAIFVFMLFLADRAERAVTQALLIGVVVAVITPMLLFDQLPGQPVSHRRRRPSADGDGRDASDRG